MANSSLIGQFFGYAKARRKWFLMPVILLVLAAGALLIFAQGSALAPFIYTIF